MLPPVREKIIEWPTELSGAGEHDGVTGKTFYEVEPSKVVVRIAFRDTTGVRLWERDDTGQLTTSEREYHITLEALADTQMDNPLQGRTSQPCRVDSIRVLTRKDVPCQGVIEGELEC